MARYSKTNPRKSLKTLQDKEFKRHEARRAKATGSEGGDSWNKMQNKHFKMWKKRHDAEVDRKWEAKEAKNKKWKMWKKKHDAEVDRKWKEKSAFKTNKRQKKSGEKQVVDTDYLYGSWMKDKK